MSGRKKRPPKRLQWRLECLGHSVIERLAGLLPGPWAFRLGETVGGLLWHFMPQRRRIILRNLRIACASFRRSGANLICAAHSARLTPEKLAKVIHIENLELLEKALATGKGVVLLLAHTGNWEILSRRHNPAGLTSLNASCKATACGDGSHRDSFLKAQLIAFVRIKFHA